MGLFKQVEEYTVFFFQSSSETGLLVALLAQDGVEPERLEDLVAPSHVNTRVDRTVRTRVEFPLRDLFSNWSKHDIINTT